MARPLLFLVLASLLGCDYHHNRDGGRSCDVFCEDCGLVCSSCLRTCAESNLVCHLSTHCESGVRVWLCSSGSPVCCVSSCGVSK